MILEFMSSIFLWGQFFITNNATLLLFLINNFIIINTGLTLYNLKIERNRILIASLIICIITGSIAFSLKDFSILGKLHLMLIIIICSIVFKMNLFISSLIIVSSFTLYSALFGLIGSLILWTLKTSLLEAVRNPLVIFLYTYVFFK
ncbi:hypothetical protein KQI42_11670 [Tissierella sp. MSJ-40]|uniref:Uncharacterized protein n=1 Tax=Tissierella simiarum TaxID=2841534 RepID=A0ABS6E6Y2_9FIRM|nr:hypothetical protein [Tissierella simiarum]MBU5438674.1 hypothetical protein [Tissierella simiarum]